MFYKKNWVQAFEKYAYKDERDGQKCHLSLKTYGAWKIIDFGDTGGIKMKM